MNQAKDCNNARGKYYQLVGLIPWPHALHIHEKFRRHAARTEKPLRPTNSGEQETKLRSDYVAKPGEINGAVFLFLEKPRRT